MSANTSGEQMIKTWAEAQRQLLTNWIDMVRAEGGVPDAKVWNKTVDSWRTAVMNTLDTQAIWTRTWVDSLAKTPGAPDEMQASLREGQENFQRWTDAQRQLWQNWFDLMKETAASAQLGKAPSGEGVVDLWSTTTRTLLDAQTDWVRRWSDAFGGGKH